VSISNVYLNAIAGNIDEILDDIKPVILCVHSCYGTRDGLVGVVQRVCGKCKKRIVVYYIRCQIGKLRVLIAKYACAVENGNVGVSSDFHKGGAVKNNAVTRAETHADYAGERHGDNNRHRRSNENNGHGTVERDTETVICNQRKRNGIDNAEYHGILENRAGTAAHD